MTIKELIEKLSEFDPNMNIKIFASFDCGYGMEGGDVEEFKIVEGDVDWDDNPVPTYLALINHDG